MADAIRQLIVASPPKLIAQYCSKDRNGDYESFGFNVTPPNKKSFYCTIRRYVEVRIGVEGNKNEYLYQLLINEIPILEVYHDFTVNGRCLSRLWEKAQNRHWTVQCRNEQARRAENMKVVKEIYEKWFNS